MDGFTFSFEGSRGAIGKSASGQFYGTQRFTEENGPSYSV